ncbi:DUF305 domain-containing protein [Sphingomicrobium sediminis]|uniref:DUF305 domain-containing protein n=1 Tax=Sphingomicrobium sediminis TaxID=2950949 RepID=A0A9X2EFK7_9SPHN|nr:DUF305 domain-containing protein [Sphingomicrobium sediminis]MCM8556627.1 DUF305 domain-containing protein [Sphingomicrobium sediminis]
MAQQIVQPGAPGEAPRAITAEEAARIADTAYIEADAIFMQGMIHHHHQAVVMANMVNNRTNNEDVIAAAARITAGQDDEIAFMRDWLMQRGEYAPNPGAHEGMDHDNMDHENMDHAKIHASMSGMATDQQLAALAAARGVEFDRMFLELMIAHHEGALAMVQDLFQTAGTARDPVLAEFAADVRGDQTAEIATMNALLAGLQDDPRVGLAAGFEDAGEAIWNLNKVVSLSKPVGFFDPANPSGLPPVRMRDGEEAEDENGVERMWNARSPLLSFSQTDMAFQGDTLITGNYHGFNIYTLGDDGIPDLVSSVVCPGGQGDVSVVGDLLIMSVEQGRGRVDCGRQGVAEDVSAERFRGVRIFDISDVTAPRQVGLVQTCRGSHTHSVVDANDDRIIVYNSGTSYVRDGEELEGCVGNVPGDDRTALFSIDVIEIPLDNPAASRIVSSPRVFADDDGNIAGLWLGGQTAEGQYLAQTNQCHDITVFPAMQIAAGACSGNGILMDISDPMNPVRIDAVFDNGFQYWHSATFNNDGTKVIFTDEWGGGGRARCRASDPMNWGANAIYDIEDGKLTFRNHYKLPAAQSDSENCVAHNGSAIPVPGRDIFAQAWYQGGLSVMDFTDSANPYEMAYFDRGPIHPERIASGGYWSTYFYDGYLYGTEIARGLDVFALEPSEYLSENEIEAAKLAQYEDNVFNPQTQTVVSWPAVPVVAKAYLDQLERNGGLEPAAIATVRAALDAGDMANLANMIDAIDGDSPRRAALADTLRGIVGQGE